MTFEAPVEEALESAGRVAAPAVAFGEGRRPEAATKVRLESFDGPLALLLALIEARQLDVVTVPLGPLADAYLDALATLEDDRLGNISAFVAVASQLILIKSRAILPRAVSQPPGALPEDEPDPEAELRARLLVYRAHRDAGRVLQELAIERIGLFRREPGVAAAAGRAGARPPDGPPLDVGVLIAGIQHPELVAAREVRLPPDPVRRDPAAGDHPLPLPDRFRPTPHAGSSNRRRSGSLRKTPSGSSSRRITWK